MKYLILIFILFAGCKVFQPTEWKSQKRINKVEHFHPYLLAQYCAKEFPVKSDTVTRERYKQGDTVTVFQTIDCDTARVTNIVTNERLVRIPYAQLRVDTFFKDIIITKENTAGIAAEKAKTILVTEDRDKKSGKIKVLTWIAIIEFALIVLGIVGCVLLWKFKLKNLVTNK